MMAVVKTEQIGWAGKRVKRVIKCNKDGVFSCKLPPECEQVLGENEITAASMSELLKKWNDTCKRLEFAMNQRFLPVPMKELEDGQGPEAIEADS
jgi:hypothetical protein